jgi:hypothetical protein
MRPQHGSRMPRDPFIQTQPPADVTAIDAGRGTTRQYPLEVRLMRRA